MRSVALALTGIGVSGARPRGRSSPYNLYMKLPALVDGRAPERRPVIAARESITGEYFRGYPDHPDGPVARRYKAPIPPPRSVEGWF